MINSNMRKAYRSLKRKMKKTNWYNLRNVKPISKVFGFDRGKPIDRYYIEKFLAENKELIQGVVLEIAEDTYGKKFGSNVEKNLIFDYTKTGYADITGDLTDIKTLPKDAIDCFICTQTLNFIYDFHRAIEGVYHVLKKNGIALVTVAGISQISYYDMPRWGDYWRFTDLSMEKSFSEVFGKENVEVNCYGNVLSSISFLEGIPSEELTKDELDFKDDYYQLIIAIIAKK